MTVIVQLLERRAARNETFTANERAWIDFLRLLSGDGDPRPSLAAIQALRRVLWASRGTCT